ncbi:hypothetical protein FRC10_004270 [Ceratobasidium sp. 414]|nr:hypothetical protein FRC10_004270 [Ceratobasidium sp. 414]
MGGVEIIDAPPAATSSPEPVVRKSPPRQVYMEEVEDVDAPRAAARRSPLRRARMEEVEMEDAPPAAAPSPEPAARKSPPRRVYMEEVEDVDAPQLAARMPPPRQARAEEIEDEDEPPVAGPSRLPNRRPEPIPSMGNGAGSGGGNRCMVNGLFVEDFPISTAGAPLGTRLMTEEDLREYLESCGRLGDPDLLETAEILLTTGLTGRGRTRHLKGPMYKWKGKGMWRDNADLMNDIDKLPWGAKWTTAQVMVGEGSHKQTRTIYLRDVLEVIRQLLGARRFKRWMRYTLQQCWTSPRWKSRVYDEMWSADWWWRMQYLIGNPHGTVVPLIVATNETTLTNNAHGPKAHPVYLSLGNISKKIRRRPTKQAMILIGYIPVDAFEDVADDETRQRYRGELLHRSLERIFEPLKDASSDGMLAWCADGCLRHVYPIIASWVADYPEQCDVACTTQSGCPKCMQKRKGRGGQERASAPLRDPDDTLRAIHTYHQTGSWAALQHLQVRPCHPFWADIPHVDIGSCLTPDLLHQLYKGMYEHLRNWTEELLGTKVFDQQFKQMPSAQDL